MCAGPSLACFCLGLMILTAAGEEPTRQWYKGNTHTHTLWSDGNDFPDMVAAWYRNAGYHFLALSDHNVLSRGEKWMSLRKIQKRRVTLGRDTLAKYRARFGQDWVETRGEGEALEVRLKTLDEVRRRLEKPGEFLLIEAEEITDEFEKVQVHINALNLRELIPPQKGDSTRETLRNNLRAVRAQEKRFGRAILAHINHPNFRWSLTAEDLAHVIEEDFFEVYNGHPSINHLGDETRPGDERLWDIACTIRLAELQARPLYGLATDDSHHYHGGDVSPGRGWIMVHAAALDPDTLIQSLRQGAFYASTGVTLTEIDYATTAKAVRFKIRAEPGIRYETEIIGTRRSTPEEIGETLAKIVGPEVHYELTAEELYVRATVTSSKPHPNPSFKGQREQAWTQPIGWRR